MTVGMHIFDLIAISGLQFNCDLYINSEVNHLS